MNDEPILIPFIDSRIPAGFPSPANDYLEDPINLSELLMPRPLSTFIMTSSGDSMNKAFIPDRSILVVDRSLKPKNDDIVVATYHGVFTVKYYCLKNGKLFLVPANEKYAAVEVTEEMEMQVWGVVTFIIINPKDVSYVRTC